MLKQDLYKILRMLKIASSFIKIKNLPLSINSSSFLFSSETSRITEETFALVLKRL